MNSNNKKNIYTILILLLVVVILVYFIRFGKIKDGLGMPTGNVDIYDITVPQKDPVKGIDPDLNIYDPEKNKYDADIFVDDKNGDYIYQQKLQMFENPSYEYTNKIAPGSHNIYQFVVHNSSTMNLKYKITMYEQTPYKVNLKYRLRRNGYYLLGGYDNWITADELVTSFSTLNASKNDVYHLEWKWFDDDYNDTIAGENMRDVYKLFIRFYFEEIA